MKLNFLMKSEKIGLDDCSLVINIHESERMILESRNNLENKILFSKDNYFDVKMAKLAYNFISEEHETLYKEAQKRGLCI